MTDTPQSLGGQARAEALSPDERVEIAKAGARAAHSPARMAQRIVKAWSSLSRAERAEVRGILRDGEVIPR
jgi:hypothetical protein